MIISYLFLLISALLSPDLQAETNKQLVQQPTNDVTLYYFWSRHCPHCKVAKPFVNQLPQTYPWLTLHSYDLVDSRVNQKRFLLIAQQLEQPASSVPAFIFCGQMMVGYDQAETTGKELEEKLLACHRQENTQTKQVQENFNIPGLGEIHYQDFSLPVFTLLIAALDAFVTNGGRLILAGDHGNHVISFPNLAAHFGVQYSGPGAGTRSSSFSAGSWARACSPSCTRRWRTACCMASCSRGRLRPCGTPAGYRSVARACTA